MEILGNETSVRVQAWVAVRVGLGLGDLAYATTWT